MDKIFKVLNFLRLTDNNIISLTNVAVMITLYKLLKSPVLSVTDTTALVVALVGHHATDIFKSQG